MSDVTTPESTTETTTPAVNTPLEPQPKTFDEAYVKSLREEAAAARVGKKDAVEAAEKALREAHSAELASRDTAYTELQGSIASTQVELQKLYTALDADVPSSKVRQFVAILQGTDEESINKSAKDSLDLIGGFDPARSPAFDPSQGRGGKTPLPLNGDPILAAIKAAVGIK